VAGYTKMVYPLTVTHPSINRVRRGVTPLIENNALPLSQATTNTINRSEKTAESKQGMHYKPSLLVILQEILK